MIPVADRKITCPAPPALKRIWRETTNPATYFKDSGVCAAISNFEKAKGLVTAQVCCNEPSDETEYLGLHPNPSAIDCKAADPTTNRVAGYYYKSFNGAICYGIGTKSFMEGTPNQYCGNETFTDPGVWPADCTNVAPTPIACPGTYTLSGNGQKCVGYKTLLVGSGSENQYCANEESAPLVNCGPVPTTLPCDTSGTYALSGDGNTCSGVKTEIFNGGTPNQYCGNKIYTGNKTLWPAGCSSAAPAAMTCPPVGAKVYLDGGDDCYLKEGQLIGSGTPNQRCGNLKLAEWRCCNDASAVGCQ